MTGKRDKTDIGPDRRMQTRLLVSKLVSERTEMLALFCRAAGLASTNENDPPPIGPEDKPVDEIIREFCQVLVDYVAAGHFTLYERIANGQERRQEVREVAAAIYPQLEQTTQIALDFNDAYQNPSATRDLPRLAEALSRLGEELALRIELEDRLLVAIDPSVSQLR